MSLIKPEAHKLYVGLYQTVHENDSIITKFLTSAAGELSKLSTAMAPKELQKNLTVKVPNKQVRSF